MIRNLLEFGSKLGGAKNQSALLANKALEHCIEDRRGRGSMH
jgi:hypothetical protein